MGVCKFKKKYRIIAPHPFSWEIPVEFALKVKMKHRINVARLWVDCFDYQSNTVILAELVFRGRPCMNRMNKKAQAN